MVRDLSARYAICNICKNIMGGPDMPRLTDEYFIYLDTPDFLLEISMWSGHLNITVATPVSLHCLQSGADIREKPAVAGIVWYDLNLWGGI